MFHCSIEVTNRSVEALTREMQRLANSSFPSAKSYPETQAFTALETETPLAPLATALSVDDSTRETLSAFYRALPHRLLGGQES